MKKILLTCACAALLSACAAGHTANQQPGGTSKMTGQSAKDIADNLAAMPQAPMPMDPSVQTYKTTGAFQNPLVGDHTRGILDNSTAGGYTVFDDSVTVYPLPGEGAPAFLPSYAVPPLKGQYGTDEEAPQKAEPGMVGKSIGMASAGNLPPVKNVEVQDADPYAKPPTGGQVRRPLTLTAPEPTTMQPPVSATPGPRSPFAKGFEAAPLATSAASAPKRSMPSLTGNDDMTSQPSQPSQFDMSKAPAPVDSSTPSMQAGRRSGPSLTGY